MSEIRIKTATPDTITNIPEIIGNIKVKDINGDIRDVKKLYAKNSSGEPSLVWDATVSQSTQQTTQPPIDCPSCQSGSEVFYPLISSLGRRWDYCTWKNTGLLSSCWSNITTNEGYYTTRQQDSNKLNFLPPPPNYVMGELLSYTVPDRVLVFVNRPLVSGINNHQDKIFYGSQDNSFNCILECSETSNCQLNDPPPLSPCAFGGGALSIYDIIDQRHLLIDTGCVGTGTLNAKIDSCPTYCYGDPDSTTVCRSVNRMHPLYLPLTLEDQGGICNSEYPTFSYIEPTEQLNPPNILFANDFENNNLFLTIKDISVVVEGNCSGNSGTAWTFRLFLPIYVNLPLFRNRYITVLNTLNDIITSLLGNSSTYIGLITPGNVNYNSVIHEVYKVLSGQIKISQAIYSSNQTADRWAIIGYPKTEPADFPPSGRNYATHCIVVEISSASENETGDGCNYCANTPDKSSFKASNIRFYPLENKNLAPGDYASPLNYYGYNINKNSYFTGYEDIDQMNEVYTQCEGFEIYYGKTYLNTAQLSFQDFYNAYYQPYITTTEITDCNTTCL